MEIGKDRRSEGIASSFTEVSPYLERGMNVSAGSLCTFGRYKGEDIAWRILDAKDGRALLISERALERGQYHHAHEAVTWEECSLRSWLNGAFLDDAFSDEERERIFEMPRKNAENRTYGTPGGSGTRDRVFCLSIDEALWFFTPPDEETSTIDEPAPPEKRVCCPTRMAKEHGVWTDGKGACSWWLRSPGDGGEYAAYVDSSGDVVSCGRSVSLDGLGVRPAIVVDLSPKDASQAPLWDPPFEIRLFASEVDEVAVRRLKDLFERFPGDDRVRMLITGRDGGNWRASLPVSVEGSNEALREELWCLFGRDVIDTESEQP